MKRSRPISLAIWTALVIAFLYLPILPLIVYSFNDSRLNILWKGFTFRWYRDLFADASLMHAAMNSLIVASVVSILSVILGTCGAWCVYRYHFPLARLFTTLLATPLVIPEVIMGVGLLILFAASNALGVFHVKLGLGTIICGHVTFCFPFVLVAVHAQLVGMDPAIEEAAMDLGATPVRALVAVIVPYVMPAVISGALMAFTLSLDELIVTYFISGAGSATLPIKVFGMARVGMTPVLNAISTLFVVGTALLVITGSYIQRRAVTVGKGIV